MVAEDSYQDLISSRKISQSSFQVKVVLETQATKLVLKYLAQANTNFLSDVDILTC
jgi:hypothetical protein